MADQQRRVSLIFDADSSNAKAKVIDLFNSINKLMNISTRSTGVASLDKDLQQAGIHAVQLQNQLNKAFNSSTGKLDLTKFNESLKASKVGLNDYYNTFTKLGTAGEQAFTNLARSIATAEIPLKRTNNLLNDFATTMKNTIKWQLSSSLMHGFLSSVQSAMSYAQNLNANLNEIRIVTGQSAEEMARFAEQANRSAKELSTTTNQYAQAALIFYQQGLNDKAVKERTDAVIKMANVTGDAAKEVSSYMTAIWNNFDNGSKSIEYYADVITKLGAATAASSAEIAGGLEKFAAVGNTIGLSYEYATAMLTTIIDKTRQSEDVVGTALKTILARIQGLNLGETLDDGTTLNKYSAALASVGVQIKDASGELRSMDAILNDLGAKWQTLGKDTQVALAQVVGGVRQYNQIISLMDNWDAFEMNVDIAFGAEGELDKQAEIYAESWEASQKRVQAALEAIYSSLLDDKFFIGLNNGFAALLEQVNNFIKGLGGMKGVLIGLSGVLLNVFNKQISSGLKDLTYNLKMLTKAGRKELEDLQNTAQNNLKKIYNGKETMGGNAVVNAYKAEANAQQAIYQNAQKITAEEKEQVDMLMQIVRLRTSEQVAAGKSLETAEKSLNSSIGMFDRLKEAFGKDLQNDLAGFTLDNLISDIKEVNSELPLMESLFDQATGIFNKELTESFGPEQQIQALRDLINEFPEENLYKFKGAFEALNTELNKSGISAEEAKQAFVKFMAEGDKEAGKLSKAISALEQKIEQLKNSSKKKDKNRLPALEAELKALKNLENASETYGKALEKAGISEKNTAQATQLLDKYLKECGITYVNSQEKIVNYARMLTSTVMVIEQIVGMIDVWNDKETSLGEKLLATASTIGFLVPNIISMANGMRQQGISAIAAKMAMEGKTKADIANTTATLGWGAALQAAMGPIGWISLAITGLVAGMALLFKYLDNNKPLSLEEQLKLLNEDLERAKNSTKEAAKAIEDLEDSFDQFGSVREALDNCTEGTDAWYEALADVQNEITNLLTTFPILSKILSDPKKYFGDDFDILSLYDENGLLDIPRLITKAIEVERENYEQGQLATAFTEYEIDDKVDNMYSGGKSGTDNFILAERKGFHLIDTDKYLSLMDLGVYDGEVSNGNPLQTYAEFGGKRKASTDGFFMHIIDDIINHGIENGLTTFDEAFNSFMNDPENAWLAVPFYQMMTGDKKAIKPEQWDGYYQDRDGDITTAKATLQEYDYLAEDIDSLYVDALRGRNSSQESIGASLAADYIYENVENYSPEQREFLSKYMPLHVRDTLPADLISDSYNAEEVLAYTEDLHRRDAEFNITDYQKDGELVYEESDGRYVLKNQREGGEDYTIGSGDIAAYQYRTNANYRETMDSMAAEGLRGYEDLILTEEEIDGRAGLRDDTLQRLVLEPKSVTGAELRALTPAEVEQASSLVGEDFDLQAARTKFDENGWVDSLTEIQNLIIDGLGTGLSEEVREWARNNDATSLFKEDGTLDLSVMGDTGVEIENTRRDREVGAERYLNLNNAMPDLSKAIASMQKGEEITQEALDLILTYTDLSATAFEATANGWKYIGDSTDNALTETIKEVEELSSIIDGLSAEEKGSLNFSALTEAQKEILLYLGYRETDLAKMSEIEKENVKLQYMALINGEQALELSEQNQAAWLSTIKSWEQFNETGLAWEELPKTMQEVILSNIAEADGYDLEELTPYDADGKINNQVEYKRAVRGQQTTTGLNTLLGFGEDFKTLDEAMAKGLDLTANEETLSALQELAKALTLLTGLDITTDWLLGEDNWRLVQGIFNGQAGGIQNLMSNAYVSGIRGSAQNAYDGSYYYQDIAPTADEWLQYTYGAGPAGSLATAPVSAQYTMSQLNLENQSFDVGKGMWESNREYLTAWAEDRNNVNKWLQESGYLEADGTTLTEKGAAIAGDLEGLYDLVDQSILNGAAALDISSGKYNATVQRAYNRIIGEDTGVEDEYGITRYEYDTEADQTALADVLASGYNTAGAFGVTYFEKMAKAAADAGIDIQTFSAMLSNVDWTSPESVAQFRAQLEAMGVTLEGDFGNAIDQVTVAANAAARALMTIAEAANEYSQKTSIADKLRSGESLTPEEYQAMEDIYGEEEARQMMTMDAMGQYHLAEGYAPETVASHIESSATAGYQSINEEASAVMYDYNSGYMNSAWTSEDKNTLNYAVNHADELKNMGIELTPEQIDAFTTASQEGTTYTGMQAAMKNPEVFGADFDWNALFTALASIAEKEQEESGEAIEDAEERIPRENKYAEMLEDGFSEEDIENRRKALEEMDETLRDNEDALLDLTKASLKYDRACEQVNEHGEDWLKIAKKQNRTAEEQEELTINCRKAMADMLGLDTEDLAEGIEENEEAIKLMGEAAEGSEEALNDLQALNVKMDFEVLNGEEELSAEVEQAIDNLADNVYNLEPYVAINPNSDISGMENLSADVGRVMGEIQAQLDAGAINADQAATALSNALLKLGYDAEITTIKQGTTESIQYPVWTSAGTVTQVNPDGSSVEVTNLSGTTETLNLETDREILAVKSITPTGSAGGHVTTGGGGGGGGGGGRPRRGGGGRRGGGRGREAPRAEKKKDSEKERYHSITNVLEDLTDAFDKVSKASDRAFGKARIKLLEQQEEALQDLLSAQGTYLEEIEANLEADMDLLESMDFGVELQFDENGTLLNFEDLQNAMWDEYNSHIDENGNVIGMTDEEWKKYEEEWQERMEALAQYEETQDLWKEAKQQLQDYINQIHDIRLEQVTYAVEVDIEASENSLELLDYLLNKIGDSAWDAADAIANMGEQAQEYLGDLVTNEDGSTSFVGGQINTIQGGIAGILGNHTRDIVDEKTGKVLQAASLTDADVQGFMNGDAAAIEKVRQMGLNGTLTDAEVQALKDYHNQLLQANQALMDLRDSVHEKVLEAFQQFNEELQEGIDKIDHLGRMMQSYRNIVDIVGKENLGVSNTMLEAIGQGQVENKIDSLGGQKARVDSLKAMIADAEAKAASATTEEDKKKWQDNIDEMKKELADAEEDFMGSWEEALQSIQEQFELAVSNTIETFSDALAGPLAGSLDELQASFDRQNSLAERFLPEYEKIYELNKLNRDITNSINDTDNVKAKQELAKLQEEINALEAEGTEVSRFQTEDLRRRYELKLAELALEEAKNAKSNVQMARNADGDWSYVYTADEEDVAAAEQTYEDRMFAIQQANAEYINEMQNSLIQAQADMASEIEAIMTDETLSMEEKMQKVNEIKDYYTEMFGYYSDELQYVMDQNGTAFEDTTLSALTGFQDLEDYNQNFYDATTAMMTDLDEAYAMWEENTEAAMEAAGTSIDGFADHLSEQTQAMVDDSNEARESVENLGQAAVDAFGDITTAVENWVTQYGEKISEIITKNEALATSFKNLLNEWSNFDNKDNQNPAPTEPEPTNPGGDDDGGGDDNDEPEYMGQITIKKGYQYWGYKSPKGGSKNKVKVVNDDRQERTYKFTQMDTSTSRKRVYIPSEKVWVSSYDPDGPKRIKVEKFDTGGYTGSWGSEGRMAMLHEKEIVLNKADTANLLTAVDMIRQVAKIIDLNAYSSAGFGSSIMGMASGSAGQFEQNVHITAEFPNATDRNEIYAAFTDIVNLASQYANR